MYENVRYKKNNLSEVVCRLDFANSIDLFNSTMPKSVYKIVKKYYPIAEPQEVFGTQLQVNPLTGAKVNNVVTKQWIFWSRDKKSSCRIDSSSIAFSVKNYDVFEDLRTAILDILRETLRMDENYQGKRIGLRYINMLPMRGHENWIVEQFSKAFAAHKDDRTTRLITQLEYAVPEKELYMRLQYGYPNPDYPAMMKNEVFTIDIDAFSQGLIFDEDLERMIDNMHSEVQSCFEKMITDEYRNELNKEDTPDGEE